MSDDILRQFCVRAGGTLKVASDVYRELLRNDKDTREASVKKLGVELVTWDKDIEPYREYNSALAEFNASDVVWKYGGQIGPRPNPPTWPPNLPETKTVSSLFQAIDSFWQRIEQFQDTFDHSLPDETFRGDVAVMTSCIWLLGLALDLLKAEIENVDGQATNAMHHPEDIKEKIRQRQPDNVDVRDLCKLLEKNRTQLAAGTKSEIGVAREYTREPIGDCPKADNWLRQSAPLSASLEVALTTHCQRIVSADNVSDPGLCQR